MGTPEYARVILEALIKSEDIKVVALFTQEDRPVGRKQILTPPAVKTLALDYGIEVFQPKKLRDAISEVLAIECDYIVVAAYGQMLPSEILDHAPCINLHASLLPSYRGASPIQHALLNGDSVTGVTAMLMDETLDTGDILRISTLEIDKDEMQESLFARLSVVAADLSLSVLRDFGDLLPYKQDDSKASYCKKIARSDGLVTFSNAKDLYNRYRAFTPWPSVFLSSGLKLARIKLHEDSSQNRAGEIVGIEKDHIVVGCEVGSLEIYELQPESKKQMSSLSYINGKRLKSGDTLL